MRLHKLEILDEDGIKELDREIAEQFFIQNKSTYNLHLNRNIVPFPNSSILKV